VREAEAISVITINDIVKLIIGVVVMGAPVVSNLLAAEKQEASESTSAARRLYHARRLPWRKRHWKGFSAIGAFAALISFAAAVVTFLPRVQFDVAPEYVSGSPLPASVIVTNLLWPLSDVSFMVRICRVQTSAGAKIIGLENCNGTSKGRGGLTTPEWQKHRLRTDEKWTVYIGGNIRFYAEAATSDVHVALRYWPWLIPQLWFDPMEAEARVVLRTKPDGSRFWAATPID
jgi:hypothetical protein